MLHFAVSELGLHCLHHIPKQASSLKIDIERKSVNVFVPSSTHPTKHTESKTVVVHSLYQFYYNLLEKVYNEQTIKSCFSGKKNISLRDKGSSLSQNSLIIKLQSPMGDMFFICKYVT